MTLATWPLTDELKHYFSFYSQFFVQDNKAACKQTQHWCVTTPSIVGCYMLRPFAHPVACCWMLLRVVVQSLKPVKRLHSSSNVVGATHAHYAWFTKTYGLYPSHDVLQIPTLLGVVASVCTPLPTRTHATMLGVVASVCT